ncbi:MAG TPA: S9 family peptidase [Candidatus Acidoferrales bacterium]|nr:S9 family peptidase [Candidatus Acidoferrales bacterium]
MRGQIRMRAARIAEVCGIALIMTVAMLAGTNVVRADEAAKKVLTPEMAITLQSESDLHFSPDGSRVAFVVTGPLKDTARKRHIWALDVAARKARQLTYSEKSEFSPRWSHDGRTLAFLSDRGTDTQIYFMSMDGGEGHAMTDGKRSIQSFEWSPDGKQIAFIAPLPKTAEEEKKEKDKDDALVVDKDDKPAGLWLLDVDSHKTREIVGRPWRVNEVAWMSSGDRLIVSATDHPESDEEMNRIFSVAAADGKMTELFAPRGPFGNLKVSKDGKWISFVGCRVDGPEPHDIYVLPTDGGRPKNLTATGIDRGIFGYVWRPDGTIVAGVADGFRSKLERVTLEGKASELSALPVEPHAFDFSAAKNSALAFAGETATQPEEIWLDDGGSRPVRISDLNKNWDSVELIKPEFFHYKSFDGTQIEGALLLPANYDGHSKLPLITLVHGGPTGRWSDAVQTWGQMLVGHGYAIFYPNIRGSIGYGEKFVEMNRADWGGADYKDVMAGIDSLIARGVADPNRLGIGGWSYGGYMAEWAITQTTRFKAAVSGAGMADLISEFGTERGPAYDEWFWGQPYEKPQGFLEHSPFMFMKNAKTPTLILQGEADTTDPLGQSQQLYRGLKHYGVKAELVEYPREPHGPREEKHNLDVLNRILAWYEENLKQAN